MTEFTIPEWMEPYLEILGGRSEVERLMNGERANTVINAPLALVQMGMEERIALLRQLHERGMLLPPQDESTYHFEPRWVCEVVRSSFHNSANCTPNDPHDPQQWRCGFRYEMALRANEKSAAMLRAHGFIVDNPPQKTKEEV